ncbi:MAG: amino acid permease, partial [Pseudoflavonifractor sp.]
MSEDKSRFVRVLGRFDILALAFGATIGWGWVILAGDWIQTGGTLGAILGFGLGGIMVTFVGLTYAELCPALPKCGGEHAFSLRALGYNWSFICSWALVLSYLGVVSFEACALPGVIE